MNWLFAVLGLGIGLFIGWSGALVVGQDRGRASLEQEIRVANTNIEFERRKGDAANAKLSDRDICRQYLGAHGVSVDTCELLRGVPAE